MKVSAASVFLLGLAVARVGVADASCPPPQADLGPARDGDAAALLTSIESLRSHVVGDGSGTTLDDADIIATVESFAANAGQLTSSAEVLTAALSLVDDYEASAFGPMFLNDRFSGDYFSRTTGTDDGHEIDRALMIVQQAVMDEAYHASSWGPTDQGSDPVDWPYKPLVAFEDCRTMLDGKKWLTASWMPGMVDPPADSSVEHTMSVNATFAEVWGRPVSLSSPETGLSRNIRPLGGLYLAPGQIASVTVPEGLAGKGYTVHVGSQMINANRKSLHPRMDRMTTTVPVDFATTYIANPLGGELFLRAPYGSYDGVIDVTVSGGVVESTSFFATSLRQTTEEEWNTISGVDDSDAPAPWVSIETDNFLLNVPRLWMYDYSYEHMSVLAANYTAIMDAVTTIFGIPPEKRNNYVAYQSLSRFGRNAVGGIGYPMCNDPVVGSPAGPKLGGHHGQPGQANVYMVRDPLGLDPSGIRQAMTTHHELGHTSRNRFSCYQKEGESIVHVGATYARNTVYGMDIDESFKLSLPLYAQNPHAYAPVTSVDRAAVDWMVLPSFRAGEEMGVHTPYKHRGHAKYADVARLLGWDYFENFYHREHLLFNELGREPTVEEFCPNLDSRSYSDCRTLRLSIEAGQDLTPLIHFWGVHPDDEMALKRSMLDYDLHPSRTVQMQLLHYANLVPRTGAELADFGEKLWIPEVIGKCYSECTFYRDTSTWWNQTTAEDVVAVVLDIISRYYPVHTAETLCTRTPTSSPTRVPTPVPTAAPVVPKPTTPSNNLAFNKQATQSSTCTNGGTSAMGDASNANDGDTNPSYNDGSVSRTCAEADPWWEVDLESSAAIDTIIVYNTNQYYNRLSNAIVELLDGEGNAGMSKSTGSMSGKLSVELDFGGAKGSKVRIKGDKDILTLAEVEVLGTYEQLRTRALRSKRSDPTAVVASSIKAKDVSSSSVVYSKNRNLAQAEQLDLSVARDKWASAGPLTNYDFALERVNFLGHEDEAGPFLVHVRSGAVDRVLYADTGDMVDLELVDDVPFTVEGLFQQIEEGLEAGFYEKVTYDSEMGYPVHIHSLDEEGEEDDDDDVDFEYSLSGFARALGGAGEPCENHSDCASSECLGDGFCAEEASA